MLRGKKQAAADPWISAEHEFSVTLTAEVTQVAMVAILDGRLASEIRDATRRQRARSSKSGKPLPGAAGTS
jgi:hypothetical protein